MTLVVGLVCRLPKKGTPAVILAGDRQFAANVEDPGHEIAVIPGSSVLVAGAGSMSLVREAVDAIKVILSKVPNGVAVLSCAEFDSLLRREIEPEMRRLVLAGEDAVRSSGFGLLIACSDSEGVRLYAVQSDGIPFRVDRGPGFGCVGRGYALAGALRFNQFRTEDLSPKRAGRLVAFMILAASMVDRRVGRDPEIFETVSGEAKPWSEDALKLARERVRAQDESLNRFWGWLSPGEADFGVATVGSIMNRDPIEIPAGSTGLQPDGATGRNSNLQPT